MEKHLKVLMIQEELGQTSVKVTSIAKNLSIAPPSVVQMLRKLSKSGYVDYQRRQGASLAEKSRNVGTRILHNHRVMETFVYQPAHLDLDGRVGCAVEHHMAEDFTTALCS